MRGLNAKRSAAVGLVTWFVLLLGTTADSASTELIHKIVLFGVLVVVPLGLSLVPPSDRSADWLYNIAVAIQPIAAALTFVSFFLEKGVAAAASSWFIVDIVIALYGCSLVVWSRIAPKELTTHKEAQLL